MFGRRRRHHEQPEPEKSPTDPAAAKRDRVGSAMFYIFGPATVQGALQGHSPEARRAWKELVDSNKRARREASRGQEPDGTESLMDR